MTPPPSPLLTATTKPPGHFTGKGAEIIGNPHAMTGEIWYLDGAFQAISSERSTPTTPRPAGIAKQAAWLSIARQTEAERKGRPETQAEKDTREAWEAAGFNTPEDLERSELEDLISARQLGQQFAEAMLAGTLKDLASAVVWQFKNAPIQAKTRDSADARADGYLAALRCVCGEATHPEQVTVEAVRQHMEADRDRYKISTGGLPTLNVRDMRVQLEAVGFGWIRLGTKPVGRPRTKPE